MAAISSAEYVIDDQLSRFRWMPIIKARLSTAWQGFQQFLLWDEETLRNHRTDFRRSA